MNIVERKKRWKMGLLVFAGIIGLSSLIYTNILVKKLQEQEKENIELRLEATDSTDSEFIVFLFEYQHYSHLQLLPGLCGAVYLHFHAIDCER